MKAAALDPRSAFGEGARIVRAALLASPFPRKARPLLVVVLRIGEGRTVMLRPDFAKWLRSNDLQSAADECMRRKVGPGEVLVWCEVVIPSLAHAGFCRVNVETKGA